MNKITNKYNVTKFLKINPKNITRLSICTYQTRLRTKKIKGSDSGLGFFLYPLKIKRSILYIR